MSTTDALPERLYDAIREVLMHHRLSYTEGEDAEAFPLVDMLCPPGERNINIGTDEITLICDAIYNDEGVRAALDAQAEAHAELTKRLRDWIEGDCICPCCEGVSECSDGCTFAADAPADAERMAEARDVLYGDVRTGGKG